MHLDGRFIALLVLATSTASCVSDTQSAPPETTPSARLTPTSTASSESSARNPTSAQPPAPSPTSTFNVTAAMTTIRALTRLGPREATGQAYADASAYVASRLRGLGFRVRGQRLTVPAGVSWGVGVPAGTTRNIIAEPAGFNSTQPHLVIGAHLDTVPQSPGAVDNAAGVSILLETARLAAQGPPGVPLVFVAFGAEEPRGAGDDRHHYGSRAYVAAMPPAQRAATRGLVSIDRVGVGSVVPVCTGGLGPRTLAADVLAAANHAGIRVRACINRSSDHWSFERAGLTGVRIGSVPYPRYHSARDRFEVVEAAAVDRTGRLLWAAVNAMRADGTAGR